MKPMDKTEAVNVAFLAGVVIVLLAAFVYVNVFWEADEEEEEEAEDAGAEEQAFVPEKPVVLDAIEAPAAVVDEVAGPSASLG